MKMEAMNGPLFRVGLLLLLVCGTALAEEWKTYVNERFGFRFEYPVSLAPGRLPENGAGRNFTDGTFSVTAQGHFLHDRTIDDIYREALEAYGRDVTYKVKRPTWFVVSADQSNGYVVYKKFHVQGKNWAEFTATYPIGTGKKYDPVIERMAKRFVPFLEGDQYDRIP
jgi:hypothetical protein